MSAAVQAPAARPAAYPRPQTDPPQLLAALGYAARDWPVFPCRFRSKDPATKHGFKNASTDPATIRAMWPGGPANVAIAIPPGLVAIDFDVHPEKGQDGRPWYEAHPELFPATLRLITSNGGFQLFYIVPLDAPIRQSDLAPGVQVRAAGKGYSMAPPSIHPSGHIYQWADGAGPDDYPSVPPAPWPLLALLTATPAPAAPAAPTETPQRALEQAHRPAPDTLVKWGLSRITRYGGRDNACFKLARQVLASGYDGYDGERIILDYWEGCPQYADDPFTRRDALKCWRSAHNYPTLDPWPDGATQPAVEDTTPPPPADANGVTADNVDPGAVNWEELLAELATLRLELQEERAARLAAEARATAAEQQARHLINWQKVPNVQQGVRAAAPFVVAQYKQKASACEADADGWVSISLPAVAESQAGPALPSWKDRTPEEQKAVTSRAEQVGIYIRDMATYNWIETKQGPWTRPPNGGHAYRPVLIRPKSDAFLSDPLALPTPEKRTARPRKPAAVCPRCHQDNTRQVVCYECLTKGCKHIFTPEEADNAADLLAAEEGAPPVAPPPPTPATVERALAPWHPQPQDPKISDLKTDGPLDPKISDLVHPRPPESFRTMRDAVYAMAQQRTQAPLTVDHCWACAGPCTGTCARAQFQATIPPPGRLTARVPMEVCS